MATVNSAAAKKKKKKKNIYIYIYILFKWVQPAVRHRLTAIKMFGLASSLRKPMLTSWHFGAAGNIFGQKHAFLTKKMQKAGITLQKSRDPLKGRNVAWLTPERVLNKTCDDIMNKKIISLIYIWCI